MYSPPTIMPRREGQEQKIITNHQKAAGEAETTESLRVCMDGTIVVPTNTSKKSRTTTEIMPSRTKSSRRSRSSPANTSPNSSSNGVDDGSVDGNFDNDGHHQPTTRAAWPMWMRVGFVVFAVVALGLLAVAISITLSSKNSKDADSSNGSKNSNNNNNSNSNNIAVTTPTNVPGPTPTFAPSASHPTPKPTSNPTRVPTPKPTEGPTKDPTKSPTVSPTSSPTNPPTASPTPRPTVAYIPPNPVPPNPPRGYFNYDPTSEYGPHRWHLVDTSEHPLREFSDDGWGVWEKHISGLTWNMCDRPDRKQSPKNMIQTIQCDAHHEIRTWVSLLFFLQNNILRGASY